MPSPIEALKQRLAENVRVLTTEGRMFSSAGVDKMRKTVERIRKEIGDRPATPGKDRICGALATLRSQGAAALDGAQFHFACWGLTESCGNQAPLIEDGRYFPTMMSEVQKRKPRTLLWQGLLDAYFRYSPTPLAAQGERNWQSLRTWLAEDLGNLRKRTNPELVPLLPWLEALTANRNLFSDKPCRPYALEALGGNLTRVDRINADLGIPPTSWFWRELVFSQIEEAVGWREDARFKQALDTLLAQLVEHPVLRDKGLAKLLTRYAGCANKSVHEGLKRLSVEAWGSPQLAQQARWGHVEPSVKAMVSQWLVLEDLEDFFQRLQAGGLADKRRLAFWLRFIKQISYSHIALGSQLSSSWHPDWVEFRKKKRGRISQMWGGDGTKNAFIIKIGAYYFVEFSKNGDACYGYAEGQVPFSFDAGDLLFYPSSLKDKKRRIFWGSHAGDWEHRFLTGSNNQLGLSSNLGIYPDL